MADMSLKLSSPPEYKPDSSLMQQALNNGGNVSWTADVEEAVKDADYIYTDVWVSMGLEDEKQERLKKFAPYQVNAELLGKAPGHVKILHCLPAHRGEEITSEVIDSDASVVFDQAENRLHVQKAIMTMLTDKNWLELIK
jgi:ornithine carbamoyltransferase